MRQVKAGLSSQKRQREKDAKDAEEEVDGVKKGEEKEEGTEYWAKAHDDRDQVYAADNADAQKEGQENQGNEQSVYLQLNAQPAKFDIRKQIKYLNGSSLANYTGVPKSLIQPPKFLPNASPGYNH